MKVDENIELQIVSSHYLEEFFELCKSIKIEEMIFCPNIVKKSKTKEACLLSLERVERKNKEMNVHNYFMIYEKKIVGIICFYPSTNDPKALELGFWVAPQYQRHGVASKSVLYLTKRELSLGEITGIEMLILPDNLGSIRLAVKCGFKEVGRRVERSSTGSHEYIVYTR